MLIFYNKHFNVRLLLLLVLMVVTCFLCPLSVKGAKIRHLRQHGSSNDQRNVYSHHWHAYQQTGDEIQQRSIESNRNEVKYLHWGQTGVERDMFQTGYDERILEDDGDYYEVDKDTTGEEENVDEDGEGKQDELEDDDDDHDAEEEKDKEDEEILTGRPATNSPTRGQINHQSSAPTVSPETQTSIQKHKQHQQSNTTLPESTDDGEISTTAVPTPTPTSTLTNSATNVPTVMVTSRHMDSKMPTAFPTTLKQVMTKAPTPMPTLIEVMTNAPTVSSTFLKNIITHTPSISSTTHQPTKNQNSNNDNENENENENENSKDSHVNDDYYSEKIEPTPSPPSQINSNTAVDVNTRTGTSSKGDEMMDRIYEVLTPEEIEYLNHHKFLDEEKEAAKISFVYLIVSLFLMIFTAHQLSENPDGIYSNMCRLAITVSSCVLKIFLLPFRKICGLGTRQGYSHHLVSNDPYAGESSITRMEMI